VLIDDTGVRATMTASWLIQMGWKDVAVLRDGLTGGGLETGAPAPEIPGIDGIDTTTIPARILEPMVLANGVTVIDFATSLDYKAGHIPGAWWAVRARLAQSLERTAGSGPLIVTSPDGLLARLAAADIRKLTPRSVRVLEGGTDAWKAAGGPLTRGFERMADQNDDLQYKAYDHDDNIEFHMREYLSWEVGLVDQVERDGTARFRHFPA
jgi:rhodanese-related sulfurtransferase